jgi:hypothetical protein
MHFLTVSYVPQSKAIFLFRDVLLAQPTDFYFSQTIQDLPVQQSSINCTLQRSDQ